ncbi:beta-glucosidase BglX [Haliscomenobacter hydrossis]|uniref:Periplasmic beta-glucosidase n=1 Tax=Haliscomenobacter hydrossis (strain ATCC 27775 / DSM 1100 / LMG 10767 / O) TaxID=760192 RepID=F4KRA1_HALH1|nr:beta-glucosidase BglX [Haliscomenobacter hydrossis]AEE54288.1 Beta-glucosidase [Haliscomenobacter hydrossis DSM 1100]
MKRLLAIVTLLSIGFGASCTAQPSAAYLAKRDAFVVGLMKKMTLDEKLGQLNLVVGGEATTGSSVSTDVETKIKAGKIGGIFSISTPSRIRKTQELAVNQSRLKIPMIFGMDVIHGYKTLFPIPLGISSSWDMGLIEKMARISAIEASADGICWTFSPMVDIARDPRWGRIAEGSGEDPYLGSQIARAMVKGYQGKSYAETNTIMACVKHFALYGAAEAGRDYHTTDMSKVRMYNEYLPPYKAALDAGAGSIMASFNDIDGIPATANNWLLTDLLRRQWKFKGMVVSDYTGITEMVNHGLGDVQTVAAKALMAGNDMDMVSESFVNTLGKSLKEQKVTQAQIDLACRRVLEMKYDLGLFTDPFRFCDENRAKTEIFTAEHRAEARKAAGKSFVLLKNDKQTLPLAKNGTIALIGPLADNKENMAGTWSVSGDFTKCVSVEEGIKNVAGNVTILKARGANIYSDARLDANVSIFGKPTNRDPRSDADMIAEAVATAQKADVIVAALGEAAEMTGEASSRSDISIPENQRDLLKALVKTGKPVVLVLFTGRPLALPWENENLPAILNVWFGGTEAGNAIADVLFGDVNPSGKLSATFPRNVGQIPIYYSHKNTGRPYGGNGTDFQKFQSNYLDVPNSPLYPFGYGLSYTSFEYSELTLSKKTLAMAVPKDVVNVSVTVKNTGNFDGEEVVQLYIRDKVRSITPPVKELKGFQKIMLKKGESKTVSFALSVEDLKFYNSALNFVAEPGEFVVFVGTNSQNVKEAMFTLNK